MGTARSIDDCFTTKSFENENTMMTDYWLEFVAARTDREDLAANPYRDKDLQSRLQEFTQRIGDMADNQAKMRKALENSFTDVAQEPRLVALASDSESMPGLLALKPAGDESNASLRRSKTSHEAGLFTRGKVFVSNRLRHSPFFELLSKLT